MELSFPAYDMRTTFPMAAPGACCGVDREAFLAYSLAFERLAGGLGHGYRTKSKLVKLVWFVHRAHANWALVADEGYKWCNLPWMEIRAGGHLFRADQLFFQHLAKVLTVIYSCRPSEIAAIPGLRHALVYDNANGGVMSDVVLAKYSGGEVLRVERVLCEYPTFFITYAGDVLVRDGGHSGFVVAKRLVWNPPGCLVYVTDIVHAIAATLTGEGVQHYGEAGTHF